MAALALGMAAAAPAFAQRPTEVEIDASTIARRKTKAVNGLLGLSQPRTRWPATKPKRKRNMLHVSRRVRRKHRRERK